MTYQNDKSFLKRNRSIALGLNIDFLDISSIFLSHEMAIPTCLILSMSTGKAFFLCHLLILHEITFIVYFAI